MFRGTPYYPQRAKSSILSILTSHCKATLQSHTAKPSGTAAQFHSTFRSVTHALVVSQQTHAVMFRLLLLYTESCKIQRGFLQLLPISRCLFMPHFI